VSAQDERDRDVRVCQVLRKLQLYETRGAVSGAFADDAAALSGFVREEIREATRLLSKELADAQRELSDWNDLVAGSAPLLWATTDDQDAAVEWERRAADMLSKRAKSLTLGTPGKETT
jgi:hypothetical protein